jgi:hypothetical protein
LRSLRWPTPNRRSRFLTHSSLIPRVAPRPRGRSRPEHWGRKACTKIRQRAAAVIGRSLDAVSGSWFVILLDGRVLGIAMHVLASEFPKRPRDWTAPVDYRNGTVHIRAEVIEKPAGGEPTTWTLCYIPNKGKGNGYGCTGTILYRDKGVYERDVSMKSFWENDAIVWSEGIKQMDLVIKDNGGGGGHAHKRADWEKFFPTKMRITMVQVSAGSKYDPSLVPNLPHESKTEGRKPEDADTPGAAKTAAGTEGCCISDAPAAPHDRHAPSRERRADLLIRDHPPTPAKAVAPRLSITKLDGSGTTPALNVKVPDMLDVLLSEIS